MVAGMISSIAILYKAQGSVMQRINGKGKNDGEGKVRTIFGHDTSVFCSIWKGREGKALVVWWTESFFSSVERQFSVETLEIHHILATESKYSDYSVFIVAMSLCLLCALCVHSKGELWQQNHVRQ